MIRMKARGLTIIGGAVVAASLLGVAAPGHFGGARQAAVARPAAVTGQMRMGMHLSIAKPFPSWGALKGAATFIVLGTAGAQQSTVDQHGQPWTTTTVQVERSLAAKGTADATVRVRQLGGVTPNGTLAQSEDFPLLTVGGRYLLFLTPSPLSGEYYPVGAPQGVFAVTADGHVNSFSAVAAQIGVPVSGATLDQIIQLIQAAPALDVTP